MEEAQAEGKEYNRKEQLKEAQKMVDYEASHTNNTWGRGIKSPEERQIAFDDYCAHISKGKDKSSWWYDNPETGSHWTYETIEKWIKTTDEFETDKIKIAMSKSFSWYEKHLMDSISGDNTKVNIAGLQMALRNKFGWDRQDRKQVDMPELMASYERVIVMLSDSQKKAIDLKPEAIDVQASPNLPLATPQVTQSQNPETQAVSD